MWTAYMLDWEDCWNFTYLLVYLRPRACCWTWALKLSPRHWGDSTITAWMKRNEHFFATLWCWQFDAERRCWESRRNRIDSVQRNRYAKCHTSCLRAAVVVKNGASWMTYDCWTTVVRQRRRSHAVVMSVSQPWVGVVAAAPDK